MTMMRMTVRSPAPMYIASPFWLIARLTPEGPILKLSYEDVPRLRRSDCSQPGISRRRRGRGFEYRRDDGRLIRDRHELERIRSLAVPPAWTDVWICADPFGHLQATGVDSAGRRQYLYHDAWRERRDREKFDRMLDFAAALVPLRAQTSRASPATVWDANACSHALSGCSTSASGGSAARPTRGQRHVRSCDDAPLARRARRGARGHFRLSGQGRGSAASSPWSILRRSPLSGPSSAGGQVATSCSPTRTAATGSTSAPRTSTSSSRSSRAARTPPRTSRTWNATVLAASSLALLGREAKSTTARKRVVSLAMQEVARYLGNTPAVCRSSYVDPRVVDRFNAGQTVLGALERLRWTSRSPSAR